MKLWRLSLRDLFWLVALVAMGCGWWVDRMAISHALKMEVGRSEHLANEIHLLQKQASFLRFQSGYGESGFGT
jgi:hypothetical protein